MHFTELWLILKGISQHPGLFGYFSLLIFCTELSSDPINNENIRCTHEVCPQTYSWGASAPLLCTFAGPTTVHGSSYVQRNNFTALKRLSVRALKQKK